MDRFRFGSGDPVIDRRASFAETLAEEGDPLAAAEIYQGALALVPGWAAGWYRLGELYEKAGRTDLAADAWTSCTEADPSDPFGASVKRDLILAAPVSESLPPAFVELLFDQYAPHFETALKDKLSYRGPDMLMTALERAGFVYAARALDLGCGTGLMGEALRPRCAVLDGVDLSAGMLEAARRKGVYDRLWKADIAGLTVGERYDLIVAADVFAYVGALEQAIGWCAASLAESGRLAFTVEASEHEPLILRESRRFAHSRDYLQTLMSVAGFGAIAIEPAVVRRDRGADVALFVVTALAPANATDREGDGEAQIAA